MEDGGRGVGMEGAGGGCWGGVWGGFGEGLVMGVEWEGGRVW